MQYPELLARNDGDIVPPVPWLRNPSADWPSRIDKISRPGRAALLAVNTFALAPYVQLLPVFRALIQRVLQASMATELGYYAVYTA